MQLLVGGNVLRFDEMLHRAHHHIVLNHEAPSSGCRAQKVICSELNPSGVVVVRTLESGIVR